MVLLPQAEVWWDRLEAMVEGPAEVLEGPSGAPEEDLEEDPEEELGEELGEDLQGMAGEPVGVLVEV